MTQWFGSLELAYKYGIVFGGALLLVLIAGFIKVVLDRRRLARLMKQADHEKQSGAATADDAMLNMREKDEGDLFGIRAIEAGYFGGVAQSAPNSPAVSRRGSRTSSPAPSVQFPRGSYNPLSSTPQILINQPYGNHAGNTTSASSSVLDLAQYRDSIGHSSVGSGNSARNSRSTPSLLDQQPPVDSVFSVLAPAAYTPSSLSPLRAPVTAKLRPSQAEMTGRHHHLSTYSNNGPPSPSSPGDCPYHSGAPLQDNRSSLGPGLPMQPDNRASTMSLQSSVFPFTEEWEESLYGEPARLVDGPEKRGKKTIEVGFVEPPPSDDAKSQRGSVASRNSSSSTVQVSKPPAKKRSPPPVPAIQIKLPAFHKTAVIGASNPEFDRFRKQRLHLEPQPEEDTILEQEVEIGATPSVFSEPQTPTTPSATTAQEQQQRQQQQLRKRNHLSVVSPRSSFSFEYANSECTHPEQRAFTAQPAPRILTRQPYSIGTYRPAGQ